MQITKAEVTPVELHLSQPILMAGYPPIETVTALFVQLKTKEGRDAWGCAVAHPDLNGGDPTQARRTAQVYADLAPDLNPLNTEQALDQLLRASAASPAALSAFDLALHDLLGLAAGMPLYRIFGGYRPKIQTSATVFLGGVPESVEQAQMRARHGFRMLKIKGGQDPELDVRRVQAIRRALPEAILRLDADGGYTVEQALDVARALGSSLEMLEQPTHPGNLEGLRHVTRHSPIPVLADQSVRGPASALEMATHHHADGLCLKVAACGGLRCARQIDAIAQAARLMVMVSCIIEPALLIAAGLHLALSSPNIGYADLDGHLDLTNDPTLPGFRLEEGWLIATDVPGLGCTVGL